MKTKSVWLGFDIETATGSILKPTKIQYWKDTQFKKAKPEAPFHYKADALTGLSLILLNQHLQNPFVSPKMNYSFVAQSWLALEPHHEMHARCQPRIQVLQKYLKPISSPALETFEKNYSEVMDSCLHPWGLDLHEILGLIRAADYLESKLEAPLLYNFQIQFSKETTKSLHYLHSLLFNLRTLIATDHNAYVQDVTFESLRVDSITDYLPKPDYVSSDAVLYWHCKKLEEQMPKAVFEEMSKHFGQYLHNATCIVDSLPKSYLNSIAAEDLEDSLYLLQMDWLLGTDAGLLFRVREELYGLLEGYEKIFWHDQQGKAHSPGHNLSVNCQLVESDLVIKTSVA